MNTRDPGPFGQTDMPAGEESRVAVWPSGEAGEDWIRTLGRKRPRGRAEASQLPAGAARPGLRGAKWHINKINQVAERR